MKIDHYISQLLFQYDCVIVPELGGFIGNYKPATLQNIQNTFNPPSKQISFNKNLNSNDGLLANHIALQLSLSYEEAIQKINTFVTTTQQQLTAKKNVLIEEVGTLFLDNENRIQFEPKTANNYLLASFGLTTFQKFPIKRERLEDKITKEFKDRTTPLVVKEGKTSNKKWLVAAAITIPLTFFAIWMPGNVDLTGDLNYATLNPFVPNLTSIYTERTSSPEFKETAENTVAAQIEKADKAAYFTTVSFDDDNATPVIVLLKDKPVAEAVSTYIKTSTKKLDFHIIAGCFSEKNNAKKMMKKLKKAGFNGSIVGQRKGLWTVAYGSFSTRQQAVETLADVKNYNSKAWILNQSF